MLNEVTFVGKMLSITLVGLLEYHFLLNVLTNGAEDDDARSLDANISVEAGSISSEESDWGSDHVGAEESGAPDEEPTGDLVAVVTEDHGGNSLDDELHVKGGEVAH